MVEKLLDGNPRGFEIRTIRSGEELSIAGYGVQILDGGYRGRQNKLLFGRGTYGTDQAYNDDNSIQCEPGASRVTLFDKLRLTPTASGVGDTDTVVLLVHTLRTAVFGNVEPTGKTRKKWLARGGTNLLATLTAQLLWQSTDVAGASFPYNDDYHTDEQNDVRGYWDGWVQGSGNFNVYVLAARQDDNNVNGGSGNNVWRAVQIFNARDFSAAVPSSVSSLSGNANGWSFDFTTGTGAVSNATGSGQLFRYPGGSVRVYLYNPTAGSLVYSWMLGVRGHA